jgi:hypothetical protein
MLRAWLHVAALMLAPSGGPGIDHPDPQRPEVADVAGRDHGVAHEGAGRDERVDRVGRATVDAGGGA